MSVLFKALEKAARQNAAAQEPAAAGAAGAAGMAGGAAPSQRARRAGRGRSVVRGVGLAFVLATAVVVTGLALFTEDVERLLADALAPQPVVLAPPAPPPGVDQDSEPQPEPQAQPDPVPMLAETAPGAAPAAADAAGDANQVVAPRAESAESAVTPAAAEPMAPSSEGPVVSEAPATPAAPAAPVAIDPDDDIAALMREGAARRAAAEGRPVEAEPAVPAVAPTASQARPDSLSVEDALAARQAAQAGATVAAPIAIGADSGPTGVGGVSVSTLAMDTQASLAEAYTDLVRGNYAGALRSYDEVAAREPGNVAALGGRAAALHKLRRLPEAQAAYEKVLALQPDNREALANMIALIGDTAPRDAIRRLEGLQAQAPDFSPVPAQLGMLYARLGDVDRAAAALRRAISLSPDNALYHYNLAVVSDRAGRRADALRAYEQVLRLVAAGTAGGVDAGPIRDRVAFLRARP